MLVKWMKGTAIRATLVALVILMTLAWVITRHWGFSQKTFPKSSEHVHLKMRWWEEIGITSEQRRQLDKLDKFYREQARKYLVLWKQKLQELYGTNLPGYDRERILKLAKEIGDAYSKFEMMQAKRRLALLEILTEEQKEKLKALIKHTTTDVVQQSKFSDGSEGCGCGSCCN